MFYQKSAPIMEEPYKDMHALVKEAGFVEPSLNFLNNVMQQVEEMSLDKTRIYQPLISRKIWIFLGSGLILLLIALPFLSTGTMSILDTVDFSVFFIFSDWTFNNPFSDFRFYNTTIYGTLFFGVLFIIQVFLMKRRIDRMFSL